MYVYFLTQNLQAWQRARTEIEAIPDEAWEGMPDATLATKPRGYDGPADD